MSDGPCNLRVSVSGRFSQVIGTLSVRAVRRTCVCVCARRVVSVFGGYRCDHVAELTRIGREMVHRGVKWFIRRRLPTTAKSPAFVPRVAAAKGEEPRQGWC